MKVIKILLKLIFLMLIIVFNCLNKGITKKIKKIIILKLLI